MGEKTVTTYVAVFYFWGIKFCFMSKSVKHPTNDSGQKISYKKAAAAQKLYWNVLIGKKKITPDQLPQSFSFTFHHLKAYLNEVEQEFNRLDIPYAERAVSVLPIAYEKKGKVEILITPSVFTPDGTFSHQFNQKKKGTKGELASNQDLTLEALNGTTGWP